jgi:hypothetical protein
MVTLASPLSSTPSAFVSMNLAVRLPSASYVYV